MDKIRRLHGAVNCPEMHTHTHVNVYIWSSIYNLFNIKSSYLHIAVSKERAAVLKLFNRSHKSKKTRPNSAAWPPHREFFTQRISRFSDSRVLCCHLVEIEDVITPRKITLLKYKSWTGQRIRWRQKCRYFENICFSFRGRTQINSKRGVVTNYKRRNNLEPPTSTLKNSTTTWHFAISLASRHLWLVKDGIRLFVGGCRCFGGGCRWL